LLGIPGLMPGPLHRFSSGCTALPLSHFTAQSEKASAPHRPHLPDGAAHKGSAALAACTMLNIFTSSKPRTLDQQTPSAIDLGAFMVRA
jgi:hypothetical protein